MPNRVIKVLIIEDNAGDVVLIKEMLAEIRFKKFELTIVETLKDGLLHLEGNAADVVLLDLSLPDSSGLNTFKRLHGKFPLIPIILMTGLDDEDMAVKTVQEGAQEYLVKGAIDSTLLSRAVLYSIERSRLLSMVQSELAKREITEIALTKANRALKVLSECNQVVVRAQNEEELFENICRVLTEIGEFCLVWILLLDEQFSDSGQRAFHCFGNDKFNELKMRIQANFGKWLEERDSRSTNTVITDDSNWEGLERTLLFSNIPELVCNSSISLPLTFGGVKIGFINIYSGEADIFSREEVKLLAELTDDISLGLHSIRIQREREVTLKNLKESEERFRFIVEATNNVIYQLSYDSKKYRYINPAIKNLTGYTPDELNDIDFSSIIEKIKNLKFGGSAIGIEELKDKLANRIGGEFQADYLIRTKEGELRWLTDHSYPWFDEKGIILGAFGIMSDITERMRAEEEIILAKEQAEEMNRLKTNFLSNMSHELRTPMVGILGYSEIMKNETKDDMTKRMADLVYKSGTRLMETLNLILDLSRLEAEKIEMTFSDVEIISLVKTVAEYYDEQASEKKIFLKIESDFSSLYVQTDERMLRNSLNNLINNAVKFTSRGGVRVLVGIDKQDGKNALIKIIDTGIGISEENQEIMWDEFRQASEGFNRNYEGTGLGLTITKKFIQKLGGSINVESRLKEGSTFFVRLPLKENGFKYAENVEAIDNRGYLIDADIKSVPKVLFVDDDETSRNVIIRFLKGICSVDCAVDGNDAVAKARKTGYDVVLMDINLGKGMNGLETTRIIREIKGYEYIPIIAVTAYAMKGDREEFLNAGCTSYIAKPFSKAQFVPFVEKFIKIK
jgi:PAS domain S-box-containing protein